MLWTQWDYENPDLMQKAKTILEASPAYAHCFPVEVAPLGFWYDGSGLFGKQFCAWSARPEDRKEV